MALPRVKKHNCAVCRCPMTLLNGDERVMCLRCEEERKVIPITSRHRSPPPDMTLEQQAEAWLRWVASESYGKSNGRRIDEDVA